MSELVGLVGREREVGMLAARLRDALSGSRQVVLIAGEPGVGKTRLAVEAARLADSFGMRSCWGRASEEDGSPPYWPLRQVVHALGDVPEELAVLIPGGHADGAPAGDAAARFQVFEAVTRVLAGHAAERGLLIVLDDLQWADPSTLRGLVHLARGSDASRLAIVATYRDTELSGRDALRGALGALAREPAVTRLRLVGLTEAQVSEYLAAVTGRSVPEDVVSIVNRRSKGNPFFVGEFAHLLGQGSDVGRALPDGARDAVRGRLAALSPECLRVLATAAFLGDEIRPESVAAVVRQAPADVVASLDEAREAGVVDGSRFRHDIVREAARMELPTAARLSVHQRMAEHLEGRADVDDRVAEVADHWLAALPLGDARRAVAWTRRAAEQAAARLAFEDAAALYARAVAAAASDAFTAPERCQLLIAQARTQVTAFDLVGAERSLTAAVAIARQSGDADAMSDAALTLEGLTDRVWGPISRRLCEEALAALPESDSPRRARLLAQLAADCMVTGAASRSAVLSEQALAMAERLDDHRTLVAVLRGRQFALAGPDGTRERLALGDRMVGLGLSEGDDEAALWGRLWRFDALVQRGEMARAEGELASLEVVGQRVGSPLAHWHVLRSRAALAFGRGRYDEATTLGEEAARIGEQTEWSAGVRPSDIFLAYIRGARGEALPALRSGASWPPWLLGNYYLDVGRFDEVRASWPGVEALGDFMPSILLGALAYAGEAALALDDHTTAAAVYRQSQPFAELFISGGAGAFAIFGSMHRTLGVAAATLGRLDDAVRHLRDAIKANDRAGLRPWSARARYNLADVLARRRRTGDLAEAAALAASAAATAEEIGMRPLARQADELVARLGGGAGPLTTREREVALLVAQALTNRQIAAMLHISERTAENHVQHILTKLGFTTRTQIATWMSTRSE